MAHKKILAFEKAMVRHEELDRETMEYSKVKDMNMGNLLQTFHIYRKITDPLPPIARFSSRWSSPARASTCRGPSPRT